MVTYVNKVTSWEHPYMEYRGLSTDTKPTDAPVNSKFVELDTGVKYYFNDGEWSVAPTPSDSSGGGSGGADKFVVTLTNENDTWTADKTIAEILEAYEAGANVVCSYPTDGGSYELPCIFAAEIGEAPTTFNAVMFSSNIFVEGIEAAAVTGYDGEGSDVWGVIQTPIEALPSHTSANNGQVLGVSSGNLAWVTPESGADKFVVTFTEENDTISADKTTAEIGAAYANDEIIVARVPETLEGMDYYIEIPLSTVVSFDDPESGDTFYYPIFIGFSYGDNTKSIVLNGGPGDESDEWGKEEVVITEDDGSSTPASVSWNDLTDKPFYESTVAPAIYYVMPQVYDGTYSYVNATIRIDNTDCILYVYRVGDALTAAQLEGASIAIDTFDAQEGKESSTSINVAAGDITNVTNGRYIASNGIPYVFVSDANDNDIYIENVTDVKRLNPGTYLVYVDTNAIQTGSYTYSGSLTKPAVTSVHKLNEKFYDKGTDLPSYSASNNGQVLGISSGQPAWINQSSGAEKFVVTMTNDNDTWTANKTIAEIITAKAAGDNVVCEVQPSEEIPVPFEIPCTVAESVDMGGMTMDVAMFGGVCISEAPIIIAVSGVVVSNTDEWGVTTAEIKDELPSYSSANNGQVLGVNGGGLIWMPPGTASWNDVTNKPFYETVIDPGFNYLIDLSQDYVSGYLDFGAEVPCKFYRVGDVLTASQLEGATGSLNNGVEIEYGTIQSSHIDEIEENGETIGLFVASDMPFALVINNDNTTLNYSGSSFACSGTFASAGTYLFWIDLSIMEEGASAYNPTLVKEANTNVTMLAEKYYKAPFIVTADLDLSNTSVSNISASFASILAAIQGGRQTSLVLEFNDGTNDVQIPLSPSLITSVQIHFSVTAPYAFDGTNVRIYTIDVYINDNDNVFGTFYLHDATAQ